MRFGLWSGIASFLAGLATGAMLVFSILRPDDNLGPVEGGGPGPTVEVKTTGHSNAEDLTNQTAVSASSQTDLPRLESAGVVAPENRPNTPPIYVDMLGPSYRSVSMEDLHLTFSLQPREEAWAFAVESEVLQYVANNNVAEWAEIEYVECRASICEIAGYLLGDTTHDAREIVDGISQATWWHRERSTHQMRSDSDGLARFVVIVTGLDFENRVRPPRPVQQQ